MEDYIIVAVVVLILGSAAAYIYRSKKKGHKCIGCPSGTCNKNDTGSCNGCTACEYTDEQE